MTVASNVILMHKADRAEYETMLGDVTPITHTCDDCGDGGELRMIPRSYMGDEILCRDCYRYTQEATEYDFRDWRLVHPITAANLSRGPHTPEDWGDWQGVSPIIPLAVVAEGFQR